MEFLGVMGFFIGIVAAGFTHYLSFGLGYRTGFYSGIEHQSKIIYDRLKKIEEEDQKHE